MKTKPVNRRNFIKGLGLFMILPSAGRVWKATKKIEPVAECWPATPDEFFSNFYLPRYDFINGKYVPVPYLTSVGNELKVNPEWVNAPFEMMVKRL